MPKNIETLRQSSAMQHCHVCAPKDWLQTPNVTGDFELDASIAHCHNVNAKDRLKMHSGQPVDGSGAAYGHKSAYNGYHGYSGDD